MLFYFLHIHKGGGTYLINQARRRARLYPNEANGNPLDVTSSCEIEYWMWDHVRQRKFLLSLGDCFIANEHALGEELVLHPKIVYLTMLRDPLNRVLSQFNAEVRGFDMGAHDAAPYAWLFKKRGFAWFCEHLASEVNWANNYMIKQLTTSARRKFVTADDLKLAMGRLGLFDVVAIFEKFPKSGNLMARYDWPNFDEPFESVNGTDARAALSDHPAALAALEQANALDLELYRHWEKVVE